MAFPSGVLQWGNISNWTLSFGDRVGGVWDRGGAGGLVAIWPGCNVLVAPAVGFRCLFSGDG